MNNRMSSQFSYQMFSDYIDSFFFSKPKSLLNPFVPFLVYCNLFFVHTINFKTIP